jgi:hypothetical protein
MGNRKNFVRQKTILCGRNRKQVEVYNYSDERQKAVKGKRNKRKNVTPPKQQDLNDRNSKKYFGQLVLSNFLEGDYILHATYTQKNLPNSFEEAQKEFRKFTHRVQYHCKKKGMPEPRFINVTERSESNGRVHHHCFLKCELTRDEIENLWRFTKKKGEKIRKSIGYINVDRLQGELDPIIGYVAKDFGNSDEPPETAQGEKQSCGKVGRPKNKRRWTSSKNLTKPVECPPNDSKWSRRELERAAKEHADDREYWEKCYPGWTLVENTTVKARYSEETGWSLDIKLRRKNVQKTKTRI